MNPGCNLVIHWSDKLPVAMAMVMLSRATRIEDVHIVGNFTSDSIKCDTIHALPEAERLLELFDKLEKEEKEKKEKLFKISYLNVRSIKSWIGKREDVLKDDLLLEADILCLAETWLEEGQTFDLNGYKGHFSNGGKGKGVAGFSKIKLISQPETVSNKQYSAVSFKTKHFNTIFLYLSNGYDKDSLFHCLDDWIRNDTPTVIMGDINEDILVKESKFEKYMDLKGFCQLIKQPTSDKGSLIDHIYVNNLMNSKKIEVEQVPVYYSDHDVITLYISK